MALPLIRSASCQRYAVMQPMIVASSTTAPPWSPPQAANPPGGSSRVVSDHETAWHADFTTPAIRIDALAR